MAKKRRSPVEQSLFDNLEPADDRKKARDAAIRASLAGGGNGGGSTENVALHEAAQSRYPNYALSVITSRALPDDGDAAAAMRYTECRLARASDEMLSEIEQTTVPFRPNYDGTKTEPVVLPARIPNLLVNGTTGIAVGMATNVPPHNLTEVCTALTKLLDNDELSSAQLCRYIKGPDFPTGGQILNSRDELTEMYKTGQGGIRLRGTWDIGPETRSTRTIYIESIPYTVNKSQLVERIAEVVVSRKLPQLIDVKDLSADDV